MFWSWSETALGFSKFSGSSHSQNSQSLGLVTKTMVPDFSILASRFWFANPWFIYLMLTKMGKKDLVINFLMIFGYLNSDSPFPRYKMRGRVQYMTIFRQVKVAKNWTSSLEFQNWSKMSIFFQTELRTVASEFKSFPNLESIRRKRKRKQT